MIVQNEEEQQDILKLTRFCGEELYPVSEATWHIYEDDSGEPNELWLEIRLGKGTQLHEDTELLAAKPHWELTYRKNGLEADLLQNGFVAEILQSYNEQADDYDTNFYYCEHEGTDDNRIEVLDRDEQNRLLIRVTGETQDVNFYDGSKPKNKLIVETWFEQKLISTRQSGCLFVVEVLCGCLEQSRAARHDPSREHRRDH